MCWIPISNRGGETMKTKQKTYEGGSAYGDCKGFADAMMTLYDVKKITIEEISKGNDWLLKVKVTVRYKQ